MFGLGKLAVLESKLNIYEDLSKEMLDKLEKAVGTISDNSNKIAIILERHENSQIGSIHAFMMSRKFRFISSTISISPEWHLSSPLCY